MSPNLSKLNLNVFSPRARASGTVNVSGNANNANNGNNGNNGNVSSLNSSMVKNVSI